MAGTNLRLDEHWRALIEHRIVSGHQASVSQVIEAGLRRLEAREGRSARLRAHVAERIAEADAGEFVDDYSIEAVIAEAVIAEADKGGAPDRAAGGTDTASGAGRSETTSALARAHRAMIEPPLSPLPPNEVPTSAAAPDRGFTICRGNKTTEPIHGHHSRTHRG